METTPLTPEVVFHDLRTAASPAIAPDGSAIVFALTATDRESGMPSSHLWLVDPDGANPRQLTTVGITNSAPAWSPDSRSIAFVAQDDGEKPHTIRMIDVAGGESRELVRHRSTPMSLVWSPDGSTLAYAMGVDPDVAEDNLPEPANPPKPRVVTSLQYKEDLRGIQNTVHLQVFLIDRDGGESHQVTSGARDHAEPQWSPDGSWLAVKIVEEVMLNQRLGIVDATTGETTLVGDLDWNLGTFRWSRDGSFILFDGGPDGLAQTEYYRYDVASGDLKRLTSDLQFVPEGGFAGFMPAAQPVWLDDETALVSGVQAGGSGLWTIKCTDGTITERARFEATHSGLSVDTDHRWAVHAYSAPDRQGEVVVIHLAEGTSQVITDLNDDVFAASPPGATEHISTESAGETIEAWVTFPPDFDAQKSYPVVLEVHGGPYGFYGYSFNATAQLVAASGVIVVSSNPRGSTSYGRRFAELVIGDWGGGDWLDVQAALDAVLALPYADRERTGIMGYSYGGYMTSWAIGQTARFKAAVCGAPVFDFESFYGTSDISYLLGPMLWGGSPPEHREWMQAHSPSTHIYNAVTPTLILHGEADVRCPIGQGEELFAALVTKGVDTEFVRYPNSNHLFLYAGPPAYQIDFHIRTVDWFARYFSTQA